MRIRISDTDIDWQGVCCPADLESFRVEGPDADAAPAALSVFTRRVSSLPPLPAPDYEVTVTAIKRWRGELLGWNVYEDAPHATAFLELAGRHATISAEEGTWDCSIMNMLMLALLPQTAYNGCLLMHASLVEHEGRAVAFTAASGTGKSTQADLWREHLGAEIMNGDRAFVRREGPRAWRAFGSPWSGSSPYVRNVDAPLAAVIVLEQAPENRIRRLGAAETMAHLYNNIRYPFWDADATAAALDSLDALVREVPIFLLSCRPDTEAVDIARAAVWEAGE